MVNPQKPDYANTPVSPERPGFNYQPEDPGCKPAVSIITPFFNTDAVFLETAQSVLRQSLQQWEWIIVNDGSTDAESLRLLQAYRNVDPRIRVVDHPANRGLPAARNTGWREARSDYFLYLDSDDLLEPTAAEKWLWFLESHPAYSFAGGYSLGFGAHEYLWQSGFQDQELNLERNRINHVVMVKKGAVVAVGGYDESMRRGLEDWDFWVRSAAQGYWGSSVPEYLHWYRTRATHMDRWGSLQEDRIAAKRKEFRDRYPQLWDGKFPKFSPYVALDILGLNTTFPCENRLSKTRPRILILSMWLVAGGAEKFNLDLMRQLIRLGWEVSIATTLPSDNPWQHEFEQITPDVFPIHNFVQVTDYARFLCYLIESRQVDALWISASPEAYRLLPYLRNRYPHLPILDYVHFVTPDWLEGGFARFSVLFQSYLDLSGVTSQNLKDWMVAQGGDETRIQVCTANVDIHFWKPDPEKWGEVRARLGIPAEQCLVLYVGRLEQQKQPKVFAKTMLQLAQAGLSFLSLAVGDGSFKPWLDEFIAQNQLQDRVRLLGALPLEQVRDLMAAGDIVFLPSENEGIALTLYEGMASGLVPVGADVGGQRELVTPECGLLLPRSSEDDEAARYAAVLADLVQNPEKRRQMGQSSLERVISQFSLEKMGERMDALLGEAGRLRRQAPREPGAAETLLLLARQATEFFQAAAETQRLAGEVVRLDGEVKRLAEIWKNPPMPPAPARTYMYMTVRQLLLPLLGRFTASRWLQRAKGGVKRLFVKR